MRPDQAELVAELFKSAAEFNELDRKRFLEEHCDADPEVRAEVESLLAEHDRAATFLQRPAIEQAAAALIATENSRVGEIVANYEVLSLIGSGGMGDVYLARDLQLHRQAALKVVRRGMDSADIIRRFHHEERLLASLNHPNIAQLYGGGITSDGIPYFAMEYIEGRRIDEYCRDNKLTIPERLELFRKVCAAIHFAHQHLVIHRDVKPSNILVTSEGAPKLVDFGIGKLLEGTDSASFERTLTIAAIMTPEYSSPEHIRGEAVTTASDIYSLGVLLYELLTGQRPYRIETRRPHEIARIVCETQPTRPSAVVRDSKIGNGGSQDFRFTLQDARSLRGDLDNIVLLAMRKEPQRRYSSAAQFSEDIRRYLDGLPVRARKDTFSYRSSKFLSRHRISVAAAGLIFLTLVTSVVISLYEARKAQRRFDDVRQLAHSLMFEIHDSVQDLQGSTPTRQLIVARALEYLDRLNAEGGSAPTLRRELASAYEKIGDIQGNPYAANLGDADGALASYRKASALREQLNKRGSDPQSQIELALSYRGIGDIMELKGNLPERLKNYRHSLDILERVAAANPDNEQAQDELARAWETLGDGLTRANDNVETAHAYKETLRIRSQLLANDPGDRKKKRALATALEKTASVRGVPKAEAVINMQRAISSLEEIAAADPQNARARREVGFAYYQLGMVLAEASDHAAALSARQRALEIREGIAMHDPKNQQAQFDLAVGHGDVAESLTQLTACADALAHAHRSIDILATLAASDPQNAIYARNLALAYERMAVAFEMTAADKSAASANRSTNLQQARAAYKKAREIFANLRDRGALMPMDSHQIDKFNGKIAATDQQLVQLKQ